MVDEASKKALSPLLFRLSKEEGVGDKLAVDKSLERPLVDTSEENTVFLQVGIFFNAILNQNNTRNRLSFVYSKFILVPPPSVILMTFYRCKGVIL